MLGRTEDRYGARRPAVDLDGAQIEQTVEKPQ
jgi:hypothetical protein